ncbi:hypothetical protein [Flavobacterium pedocola]
MTMQIKFLETDLFDNYIIEGHTSLDEVIEAFQTFRKNNTGKSIIITLDDLGQAEYTSTHATMYHDLDDTEGYDLSGIDPAAFEDGEHIGYLSTPSEFFIRKENFLKKAKEVDFSNVSEWGLSLGDEELLLLETINKSPVEYLDKQIMVMIVPTDKSYEAICGFPNGYFSGDLNPMENYALAKHLHDKYAYDFFGIGASLIGFIRNHELDEQQAGELTADLLKFYNSDISNFDKMLDIVKNSKCLLLKYIEGFE